MTDPTADFSTRRVVRMLALAVLIVAVAAGLGLGAYWINDAGQSERSSAGDSDAGDRVSVIATIEKVDPAQYVASVRVWAVPRGRFTSDGGETASRDIRVVSNGLNGGGMTLESGRRIAAQVIPVELNRGEITHYPFDRYAADLYFSATVDGRNVPVDVVVENNDAFFNLAATAEADDVEPGLYLNLSRSPGTYVMVVLMFCVMWALALAVAAAAMVIGRNRLGLVWPAMAWMAATLFALAAFRGTAPGNPPIGSVLDYTAFLWAEAIVACSLTYVVVRGVLQEWPAAAEVTSPGSR